MELLQLIYPLTNLSIETTIIIAGVFTRISMLVFFLPGLAERAISMRIRLGAAMAIAVIIAPIVLAAGPAIDPSPANAATTLAAEATAGALIGFSIRIAVYTLQTAGAIASQAMSLSQLFGGGIDAQPEPPIATLLMIAGIALAVSAGLHFKAVSALAVSYHVMPFGMFPGAASAGEWAAERAAFSFSAALSLAAPFVVLGFIYNLAIGAANRAMPQLMVAFVGVPAVTLAGLCLLALTAPVLLTAWMELLDAIIATLLDSSL